MKVKKRSEIKSTESFHGAFNIYAPNDLFPMVFPVFPVYVEDYLFINVGDYIVLKHTQVFTVCMIKE